ncbi:MAG: Gx transporter family protein [Lachnospiraceae bacterium]|nr:Gx transporter family protein [Lachnospiraceae bacterium]
MQLSRSEKTRRVVLCGVLTAAAFVLSYVESLLPFSIGVAGVKLGLANVVSLCALYTLGTGPAFGVLLARIVLTSFTFGNMSALLYSLAGGLFSFLVMWLCKKSKKFGVMGVGIAGGVTHNLGQLTVASFMLGRAITAYLPILMLSGAIAGTAVGAAAAVAVKHLKKVRR